ncbi:MAG: hypothetical protein HUU21_39775 [Polyangiaceae bacterium]|nr:hypothetical protein [Polyangiaceae bacterium]
MLKRQEYDRSKFLAAARNHGAEVSVVSDARVVPRAHGNAVIMQPVILLHYVLKFTDAGREQRWLFEESIEDKGGPLNIDGSLFDEIQKDKSIRLSVIDPTMALPGPR